VSEFEISSIQFADDGVAIQYVQLPDDIRVRGRVVVAHQIQLSASHPDYREDIASLHARAVKALRNALEDFADSEPYVPEDDDGDTEDDDDRGMGE
jgi:hypothetical protein